MRDSLDNQIVVTSNPNVPSHAYRDDSIDLIGVFLIIDKRKKILFIVFTIVSCLGFLSTISKQPVYIYTTTISIGSRIARDRASGFESTETVTNKIEKSFIPVALSEYASKHPHTFIPRINTTVARRSEVIVLTTRAIAKHSDTVKMLQQRVVDLLSKDHEYMHNSIKLDYEKKISLSEIKLKYLQNNAVIKANKKNKHSQLVELETSYLRLTDPDLVAVKKTKLEMNVRAEKDHLSNLIDVYHKLNLDLDNIKIAEDDLKNKIAEINTQLKKSLIQRDKAESTQPTQAVAMLMIDNRIQISQQLLIKLEQRLQDEIIEHKSDLKLQLNKNKRKQQTAKQTILQAETNIRNFAVDQHLSVEPTRAKIDGLKANIALTEIERERKIAELQQQIQSTRLYLDNLKPTRAVSPPMQSLRPKGIGRVKEIGLSAIAGLFLGLCLVFMLEFLEKVKLRRSST